MADWVSTAQILGLLDILSGPLMSTLSSVVEML